MRDLEKHIHKKIAKSLQKLSGGKGSKKSVRGEVTMGCDILDKIGELKGEVR